MWLKSIYPSHSIPIDLLVSSVTDQPVSSRTLDSLSTRLQRLDCVQRARVQQSNEVTQHVCPVPMSILGLPGGLVDQWAFYTRPPGPTRPRQYRPFLFRFVTRSNANTGDFFARQCDGALCNRTVQGLNTLLTWSNRIGLVQPMWVNTTAFSSTTRTGKRLSVKEWLKMDTPAHSHRWISRYNSHYRMRR